MRYEEISTQVKRRLVNSKCAICNQEFMIYEDIEWFRIRYGKRIEYAFFHTSCLLDKLSQLTGKNVKGGYIIGKSTKEEESFWEENSQEKVWN